MDSKKQTPWEGFDTFDFRSYMSHKRTLYEDAVERIALRRLLPKSGSDLIDLGANFGRLTNEYVNFSRIVLVDGSFTSMVQAKQLQSKYPAYPTCSDIVTAPFPAEQFDAAICVRTIHLNEQISEIFAEAHRLLRPGGYFIFDYFNQRYVVERFLSLFKLRDRSAQQDRSILSDGNRGIKSRKWNVAYQFNPGFIDAIMEEAGFVKDNQLGTGVFSYKGLVRLLPLPVMIKIDVFLQFVTGRYSLGRSLFVVSRKK